jgi:signal transduction histidine kinase
MNEMREIRRAGKSVPSSYEVDIIRKDGQVRNMIVFNRDVIWNGEKHYQTIWQNVTDLKKAQEQLILADRLSSVGELAAGVAHELNNPLTSVIGFSQLLLGKNLPDNVREDIKIIYSEAQRTATIVNNLLTFARKHTPAKRLTNVNSIIEHVQQMRAYEQKVNNIKVNSNLASDLPDIVADQFQLQQVFLNIIVNAEHFMIKAHQGGILAITTRKVGDNIKISFTDDGPGISREDLLHLFDPFFTTKEVGKGTGLGLSICHGIITEHNGRIYAESEPSKGATFIIELPVDNIDNNGKQNS